MAIDHNDECHAWGRNNFGQCGVGACTEAEPTPRRVSLPHVPVEISLGTFHSMVRGKEGQLSAAGANNYGQLGLGGSSTAPRASFVLLPSFMGGSAVKVSAGANHSAALDSNGVVLTWGWGKFGQLGRELPKGGLQQSSTPEAIKGGIAIDLESGYDCLMVSRAQVDQSGMYGNFGHWLHHMQTRIGMVSRWAASWAARG